MLNKLLWPSSSRSGLHFPPRCLSVLFFFFLSYHSMILKKKGQGTVWWFEMITMRSQLWLTSVFPVRACLSKLHGSMSDLETIRWDILDMNLQTEHIHLSPHVCLCRSARRSRALFSCVYIYRICLCLAPQSLSCYYVCLNVCNKVNFLLVSIMLNQP